MKRFEPQFGATVLIMTKSLKDVTRRSVERGTRALTALG